MNDTRLSEKLKRPAYTLSLAKLFVENYFIAIRDMLHDGYFDDIYNRKIKPINSNDTYLCKFLHQAAGCSEKEELFYHVLIEPFAAMKGEHSDDA